MEATAQGGRAMADEIGRLLGAGGKRLRPAFCYWGFRAAGGDDGEPIVRASAAMELLHTMALVHDDLLDDAVERRGAPTTGPWMRESAPALAPTRDPRSFGTAAAVLVGDLSAVLADRLLLESGFEAEALARALAVYHRMRIETAVGQFLDVAGRALRTGARSRGRSSEGRRLHRGGAAAGRRRPRRWWSRPESCAGSLRPGSGRGVPVAGRSPGRRRRIRDHRRRPWMPW